MDKWIDEEPKPSWNTAIFIDYHDLSAYFEEHERMIDFNKLYQYLENRFGKKITPYLYIGAYDQEYAPRQMIVQQKKVLSDLSQVGFTIRKCIKYIKHSNIIAIKGAEVCLGIDLICHAHQKNDTKGTDLIICGEWGKYRKVLDRIKKEYNKKIKLFSLAREYESNYDTFMDFIIRVGTPAKRGQDPKIGLKYIKPHQFSDLLIIFNQTSLRNRLKQTEHSQSNKSLDTYVYIDYGNIHHSLLELKHHKFQMKNLTEVDFLLLLKKKAEANNNVKKIILFMGMPQVKIDELKALRKKNERLKKVLENHGFEVHFTYNEVLFKGGMKEQGVDLTIGVDIIHAALENQFEKAILISGDADFVPVVRKLKELQIDMEIWSFTKPENNCSLSPFLILEMSKHGNIYQKIKSINSMLHC